MRGHDRIRKKRLRRAGWQVITDAPDANRKYRLVLRSPGGEQISVDAPTRPRAYRRAEELLRRQASQGPA